MWVWIEEHIEYKDQATDDCEYLKQAVLVEENYDFLERQGYFWYWTVCNQQYSLVEYSQEI